MYEFVAAPQFGAWVLVLEVQGVHHTSQFMFGRGVAVAPVRAGEGFRLGGKQFEGVFF